MTSRRLSAPVAGAVILAGALAFFSLVFVSLSPHVSGDSRLAARHDVFPGTIFDANVGHALHEAHLAAAAHAAHLAALTGG